MEVCGASALLALLLLMPGQAVEECSPADSCNGTFTTDDATPLVQLGRVRTSQEGRNLVVFFDGTGNELGNTCSFKGTENQECETSVAEMWRLAEGVTPSQVTHYETGVGTGDDWIDAALTGRTVWKHAVNGYNFIVNNYERGDKIFAFGFSRGSQSARSFQGIIHHVGVAKRGQAEAAIRAFNNGDEARTNFKVGDDAWSEVSVEFLGLFDCVLAIGTWTQSAINSIEMTLTSSVKHFRHAIALSEYRINFRSSELAADSATDSKQVWFMGKHGDVGGGLPLPAEGGATEIAKGWMLDNAEEAGLSLPTDWKNTLRMNHRSDLFTDSPPSSALGYAIRKPSHCHERLFGDHPISIHKSVHDRMSEVSGWVPLPWCCDAYAMSNSNIEWVSSPSYDEYKDSGSSAPPAQWLKVVLGQLANAPRGSRGYRYYGWVQSWNSNAELPAEGNSAEGCCHPQWIEPTRGGEMLNNVHVVDFASASKVLPYEGAVADQLLIEIWGYNILGLHFYAGRVVLNYDDHPSSASATMTTYDIGGGITLEARIELLADDASAAHYIGSPAQCKWTEERLGRSMSSICTTTSCEWDEVTTGVAVLDTSKKGRTT